MTDVSELFTTDSPWLKAVDYPDMNKQLTVEDAGTDVLTDDKGEKTIVWVKLDNAPKPIILSKTNGRTMIGAYGGDTAQWIGKKVLLTVREYHMESGRTMGWILTPLLKDSADPDDDIPF